MVLGNTYRITAKKEVGCMIEAVLLAAVGVVIFWGSIVARIDETVKTKEKRDSMES